MVYGARRLEHGGWSTEVGLLGVWCLPARTRPGTELASSWQLPLVIPNLLVRSPRNRHYSLSHAQGD